MAAQKQRLSVKEAFQLAQQPHQNQAKLVAALSRTYCAVSRLASAPGLSLLPLRGARCGERSVVTARSSATWSAQ